MGKKDQILENERIAQTKTSNNIKETFPKKKRKEMKKEPENNKT